MDSRKTKASLGIGALALAALALPLIAAPASASLADGNFLIRSVSGTPEKTYEGIRGMGGAGNGSTNPGGGDGGENGGNQPNPSPVTITCDVVSFTVTPEQVAFSKANTDRYPTRNPAMGVHAEGWSFITVNGNNIQSISEITPGASVAFNLKDYSEEVYPIVKGYFPEGSTGDCFAEDNTRKATGDYVYVTYSQNEQNLSYGRIVEIDGSQYVETHRNSSDGSKSLVHADLPEANVRAAGVNSVPLKDGTVASSVSFYPEDSSFYPGGAIVYNAFPAAPAIFSSVVRADRIEENFGQGSGVYQNSFNGGPNQATYDTYGNLISAYTGTNWVSSAAEWNAQTGANWDGKPLVFSLKGTSSAYGSEVFPEVS